MSLDERQASVPSARKGNGLSEGLVSTAPKPLTPPSACPFRPPLPPAPSARPFRPPSPLAQRMITNANRYELRRGPAGRMGKSISGDFKIDSAADGDSFQTKLRQALHKNLARVIDIFRDWDEDFSGTIDKREFRKALLALGFNAPKEEAEALFNAYDCDGGGSIDYQEMNKMLRKEVELDEELRAGAKGEIDTKARNKHALRNDGSGSVDASKRARTLQGAFLKLEADRNLIDGLALALNKKWARARDLFLEWDTNGDGEISRSELHRALGALGISVGGEKQSRAVADVLFEEIDADSSGKVSMRELADAVKPAAVSKRRAQNNPNPRRRFGWQWRQQTLMTPPMPTPCEPYRPLSAAASSASLSMAPSPSSPSSPSSRVPAPGAAMPPSAAVATSHGGGTRISGGGHGSGGGGRGFATHGVVRSSASWSEHPLKPAFVSGGVEGAIIDARLVPSRGRLPRPASAAVLPSYSAIGGTGWVRTEAAPEWQRQAGILREAKALVVDCDPAMPGGGLPNATAALGAERRGRGSVRVGGGATTAPLIRVSSQNLLLREGMDARQQHRVHIMRPHSASLMRLRVGDEPVQRTIAADGGRPPPRPRDQSAVQLSSSAPALIVGT